MNLVGNTSSSISLDLPTYLFAVPTLRYSDTSWSPAGPATVPAQYHPRRLRQDAPADRTTF
jgi:hypothetical protein